MLSVTRFNNLTWNENRRWRENENYKGCIYNTPVNIKNDIPLQILIYVIEMNNEENKIMGIGRIQNLICTDKRYKIYSEQNYNRYTYKGNKRIDREDITNNEIIEQLEKELFKGKGHFKRGQGITKTTDIINKKYKNYVQSLFD